jgi:hypothetical protein
VHLDLHFLDSTLFHRFLNEVAEGKKSNRKHRKLFYLFQTTYEKGHVARMNSRKEASKDSSSVFYALTIYEIDPTLRYIGMMSSVHGTSKDWSPVCKINLHVLYSIIVLYSITVQFKLFCCDESLVWSKMGAKRIIDTKRSLRCEFKVIQVY